jgi:ppGpp synthetase/RelA/SpoT-type nucleotidyltranferase
MKRVLRLSESDLARVVRRVIREEESMDLPICNSMMKSEDPAGYVGGGTVLRGPIDMIKSNGTVSPEFQGYTVYKEGRPFCFIPNR